MQISRRGRLAAKPAPIVKCWMHTSLFNLESFGRPILLLVDYGGNVNIYDLITDNMAICLTMRLSSNASINSIPISHLLDIYLGHLEPYNRFTVTTLCLRPIIRTMLNIGKLYDFSNWAPYIYSSSIK